MPPRQVRADVETYRARMTFSPYGWTNAVCFPAKEKSSHLYENYRNWCANNGHHALSLTNFGKKMKGRLDWDREHSGVYYWNKFNLGMQGYV